MDPGPAADTLVIQTAFLGDVVLTTPLLARLGSLHGQVDVITTAGAAPLLRSHPAVGEVIPYDKRGTDRGIGELVRLARVVRRRRYRRVYLPHRSLRTAILARLAGIPERIGFSDGAAWLYTRRVPRPRSGHEVERLLALAPGAPEPAPVSLALREEDFQEADTWLREHGIAPGFVALAPGSIWGTKRWPGFPGLAAALDEPIVVIGGLEDRALGDAILAAAPGRAANASGSLSLRGSAALLARSRLLVTNDSAPLHLATATGTPVVAIFGPTVPGFGFGPRGMGDLIVEHPDLPCRPCSPHGPERCPLGHHRCMREIAVERVVQAVGAVGARLQT